jgi:thioredoxin-dependent peroxiredoxin
MPQVGPQVGERAPEFTLAGTRGSSISLRDLKGSIVALYFYPKDDTPGCTKEAQDFNALRQEFAAIGATIVGISADGVASHDKFSAKHGLEFALAADEERRAVEAYGVWVEKSMYGKKYMGIERSTFLIDRDGVVARVWPKVKVPGHAKEVLDAARELAGGGKAGATG